MIKDFRLPDGLDILSYKNVGLPVGEGLVRSHDFCLMIVVSGTAEMEIDMQTYQLKAGTEVRLLKGTLVRLQSNSPDFKVDLLVINSKLLDDVALKLDIDLFIFIKSTPVALHDETYYNNVVLPFYTLVDAMYDYVDAPNRKKKIIILLHMYLMDVSDHNYGKWDRKVVDDVSRPMVLFRKFIDLVGEKCGTYREVDWYAGELHVTPRYLCQVCRIRNTSPKVIIDRVVLLKAKEMLMESDMSIQQVSMELNFVDQSTFTRFFRRMTGQSPKEWKKSIA